MRRFEQTGGGTMVIGVSGGLDSTHALIVAAKVCDRLGLPRTTIRGYTMPGFGTSEGTKSNAWQLMHALGIHAEEIDIRPTAMTMLENIGHPFAKGEPVHDVTFENVQAGLRTDYLFRLAGHHNGFVLGTGDLSEARARLEHLRRRRPDGALQRQRRRAQDADPVPDPLGHPHRPVRPPRPTRVLEAILGQEISPELVPAGEDGEVQSTEAKIGPYELNDFFLHHVVRLRPAPLEGRLPRLARLARQATGSGRRLPRRRHGTQYDLATIRRWLESFLQRFFAFSQFKRSAIPNGPKVSDRRRAQPARRLARAERRLGRGVAGGAEGERAG